MKRIILISVSVLLLLIVFAAWRLLGPATAFQREKYDLYIHTGMNYDQLMTLLEKDTVLKSPSFFSFVAGRLDYKQNVKAGKYEIPKGMSLLGIVRMLRNGRQTPVHFTIGKLRTKEGLAGMVGRKLECDSIEMLRFSESNDSLAAFGADTNTFTTLILPNTYTYFWNITPSGVIKKMADYSKAWWTPERVQLAKEKGLTPVQAYIVASIVEEETNMPADKGNIASVYLNRLAKGMKLAADPTIKYSMRNFELKHIYSNYLKVESPYNTYLHTGLPPGPICTPSEQTLLAVLNAPKTDYLFFAAKPDFKGTSFAATFKEHLENANAYRNELHAQEAIRDSLEAIKNGKPVQAAADSSKGGQPSGQVKKGQTAHNGKVHAVKKKPTGASKHRQQQH
ncbi:endolytic transglycosylase MltG [Flavitalea sp. BT771]|uniref:endolytic transglycosylase MltG n=1 Tax=Flavitalea sp. BT771 TaxID=3063329 RepID=UPI0026E1497A|nr:endolytic transglycosylase MltG [Flavitalea sp. BT771]MDO6431600.1 endolytic transglycosylase MltG [Flavitalea sp. BT771]MDV6220508.1 endolytic transglycosylase MltG [Flavitalea sp. BT771]